MARKEETTISDLFQLLDLLDSIGMRYWLDGGWGIDALYGKQTRAHIETDWLPTRVELYNEKLGYVDLHPFVLHEDGTSKQADLQGGWYEFQPDYFSEAILEGRMIPCISLKGQKIFHTGYELRAKDIHDLALLNEM